MEQNIKEMGFHDEDVVVLTEVLEQDAAGHKAGDGIKHEPRQI